MPEQTRERRREAPEQQAPEGRGPTRPVPMVAEAPGQQAAVGVPAPILSVVQFASPGYPPSWRQWHGTTQGDSSQATDKGRALSATAGAPGTWAPAGNTPPADGPTAGQWGVKASPTTRWTVGQYVQGATAGAAGEMFWGGTSWLQGKAT